MSLLNILPHETIEQYVARMEEELHRTTQHRQRELRALEAKDKRRERLVLVHDRFNSLPY